jgi:hypothetical protein
MARRSIGPRSKPASRNAGTDQLSPKSVTFVPTTQPTSGWFLFACDSGPGSLQQNKVVSREPKPACVPLCAHDMKHRCLRRQPPFSHPPVLLPGIASEVWGKLAFPTDGLVESDTQRSWVECGWPRLNSVVPLAIMRRTHRPKTTRRRVCGDGSGRPPPSPPPPRRSRLGFLILRHFSFVKRSHHARGCETLGDPVQGAREAGCWTSPCDRRCIREPMP